jgi:Uma2 family endonuclease
MAVAQRMTEQEYEDFVLSHPDGQWELHDGVLVEKPGMSWRHLGISYELGRLLGNQLDRAEYRVFIEGRARRPTATIFIPDVMVVPTAYGARFVDSHSLAIFSDPLPLVAEIWSPSTGDYDITTKIPVYQQRGDADIWSIHPFERTLTRSVRQPDGTYRKTVHRGGIVTPAALPGVEIDLDRLFDTGFPPG